MNYQFIYPNNYALISRGTSRRTTTVLCKSFAYKIIIRHSPGGDKMGKVVKEATKITTNELPKVPPVNHAIPTPHTSGVDITSHTTPKSPQTGVQTEEQLNKKNFVIDTTPIISAEDKYKDAIEYNKTKQVKDCIDNVINTTIPIQQNTNLDSIKENAITNSIQHLQGFSNDTKSEVELTNLNPYVDAGIVKYHDVVFKNDDKKNIEISAAGDITLTEKGRELYRVVLGNQLTKINEEFETLSTKDAKILDITENENNIDQRFSAGMLRVQDDTIVRLTEHTHITVVTEPDKQTVCILTSAKGGLSAYNDKPLNVKLSDNQPVIENQHKAQYAIPSIPPAKVDDEDFDIIEKATEYVNLPEVSQKLQEMHEISKGYKTVPYTGKGVTKEDLEEMHVLNAIVYEEKKSVNSLELDSQNTDTPLEEAEKTINITCNNSINIQD